VAALLRFTHGRPWAYLGSLHREKVDRGNDLRNVRLTSDLGRTLYPALASMQLLERFLRLYSARAKTVASPDDRFDTDVFPPSTRLRGATSRSTAAPPSRREPHELSKTSCANTTALRSPAAYRLLVAEPHVRWRRGPAR